MGMGNMLLGWMEIEVEVAGALELWRFGGLVVWWYIPVDHRQEDRSHIVDMVRV